MDAAAICLNILDVIRLSYRNKSRGLILIAPANVQNRQNNGEDDGEYKATEQLSAEIAEVGISNVEK